MLIGSSSSYQSSSSAAWVQLQQQMVQSNADQAENQARSLESKARTAQVVADQAQQNASDLRIRSDQAQVVAENAQQGLAELKSGEAMQSRFAAQLGKIGSTVTPPAAPVAAPSAVINAQGQKTGLVVNVTA